jgi:hypothetical protein
MIAKPFSITELDMKEQGLTKKGGNWGSNAFSGHWSLKNQIS